MPQGNKYPTESLSVFFLCYNDEASIGLLVESAMRILKSVSDDFEVIVVNDGSTDSSYKILEGLSRKYPRFRAVHHKANRGYGAAIKTGFKSCRNDLIFYTDGDGQYNMEEIIKLLGVLDGADMVNGYLYSRSDPFYRIVLGKVYQALLRSILRINIKYIDCDFRLFRRHVIDNIKLDSDGGFICAEMMKKISDKGYIIKEVTVSHYSRKSGRSEFFNVRNVFKLLSDFAKFCALDRHNNKDKAG